MLVRSEVVVAGMVEMGVVEVEEDGVVVAVVLVLVVLVVGGRLEVAAGQV